jgi:serine/threonine-protein kinase
MMTNVELLINLGIAKITLPQGSAKCGRCGWISLPAAHHCFKCGNPFTVVKEEHLPSKISDEFNVSINWGNMLKIGNVMLERYLILNVTHKHLSTDCIAFDRKEKRLVRIKTTIYSTDSTEGFRKFADIWLNIPSHKNILKATSMEKINNKPCLFLEYIEGKDLGAVIEEEKLDMSKTLGIAIQICEGMRHLSHVGLVHRDLKPENIIMGADGAIKISDFEIARSSARRKVKGKRSPDERSNKDICGTPAYMAPEQFDGYADKRSDIYSFGIILYQMVAGKLPFSGKTALEYEKAHRYEPVVIAPSIPPPLASIILKCLEKIPEKRYQDFGKIKAELQKLNN